MINSGRHSTKHITSDDPNKSLGIFRDSRLIHLDNISKQKKRAKRNKLRVISRKSRNKNR